MSLLMLDTDVSSFIIRKRPPSLLERFEKHAEQLCVSVAADYAPRPADDPITRE